MPDLRCPRCGTDLSDDEHLVAFLEDEFHLCNDTDVHRCPCGPLAVVEGERVTWYAPMEVRSDVD